MWNNIEPIALPWEGFRLIIDVYMPRVHCRICGDQFYAKPNWLKKGWGQYCSKKCQFEGQKSGKVEVCFICKKKTYRSQADFRKSKSKKFFCGRSCQTIWRNSIVFIGPNHANWVAGRSAYRNILLRKKITQDCKRCKIEDSRVLLAHHLDGNRENNTAKNLIWLCHNCHFLVHHYSEEKKKYMVPIV